MGMFDNVICEYPLDKKEIQNHVFQTKDFECVLDNYKITKDGKLFVEEYKMEKVPEEQRPYYQTQEWTTNPLTKLIGSIKRIPSGWRQVNFHGILTFYTVFGDNYKNFITYTAKFTDGVLVELTSKIS